VVRLFRQQFMILFEEVRRLGPQPEGLSYNLLILDHADYFHLSETPGTAKRVDFNFNPFHLQFNQSNQGIYQAIEVIRLLGMHHIQVQGGDRSAVQNRANAAGNEFHLNVVF